jgi:hypothetical protein
MSSVVRIDACFFPSHGPPVRRLVFVLKAASSPPMGRHLSSVVRVDACEFHFHEPPVAVLAFVPAAAASHPASVAGAECGSSGLGPFRTPAADTVAVAFVAVSAVVAFALATAASRPASSASAAAAACFGTGPSHPPAAASHFVAVAVAPPARLNQVCF